MHHEYKRVNDWLNQLRPEDEYRLKLKGVDVVTGAPINFYIRQIEQRLGIEAVANLDEREKAQHIAVLQLNDMRQMVEMHAYYQLQAKKENK